MDALWTENSAINGVEWYAQTLNDASQTQCAVLRFVMGLSDPSMTCAQFACLHVKWCTEVLDESRSFFRVHTGYFSNIPKCIKAEFIASWACSQSSVVSSTKR
ncbi:hypothetical protein TNCV_2630981 [Trichonephila clavipes]|nr:hypothetical protein TNCV_2630981 [Trichonephila clavipes]